MFVSPIIERELRAALRRKGYRFSRFGHRFDIALIGAGLSLAFIVFTWMLNEAAPTTGRALHSILFYICLYLSILPPAQIAVGLFCDERRNQTLELLYLTGLGPGELFLGKLLGGALIASADLLALTPFLAVPFLCGGISLNLFFATIGCFPVLLMFVISVGVLASVISRDDGAAMMWAVIFLAALCLSLPLPYYLGKVVSGFAPFSSEWLCLSPAYAPYLIAKKFDGNQPHIFWLANSITAMWSLVCIIAAGIFLNRNWRQDVTRTQSVEQRNRWETFLRGSPKWREALRRRVMSINPYQWFAEMDRTPILLAWAWIGGIVAFWLLALAIWPKVWPSPVNLYLTAVLLSFGVERIAAYATARPIGIDRRDGALELLLTTPLSSHEIVDGQAAATKEAFLPVRRMVSYLYVAMMLGGFWTRNWTTPAVVTYLCIWGAMLFFSRYQAWVRTSTVPMWIALNTGRPTMAVMRRPRVQWWYFYFLVNGNNFLRAFAHAGRFPTGSAIEVAIVATAAFASCFVMIATGSFGSPDKVRELFVSDIRMIARQPVPRADDPRFKKWNVLERLPVSPAKYVASLPDRMASRAERGETMAGY